MADFNLTTQAAPSGTQDTQQGLIPETIGIDQCRKFNKILNKYRSGKLSVDERVKNAENWWKLRNTTEARKETQQGEDGGFASKSGWLHNVIVAKHADAMEAYPEPNIIPREEGDKHEAQNLTDIIPCVLEMNNFEQIYNDVEWQKLKTGTGIYKIAWDADKLNGLGDIAIQRVPLLNIFTEPGVTDIQESRYFFHVEPYDKELLYEMYPDKLGDKPAAGNMQLTAQYNHDDQTDFGDKTEVVDVYYHKFVNNRDTVQYVKYCGDTVLYATENDPQMRERGIYDHCKYPYVVDVLFPVEESPFGYGYVDLCKNQQIEIDLINTACLKNTMVGAIPRYFMKQDSGINEADFLDLSKPVIKTGTAVNDDNVRPVQHTPLDGAYINMLEHKVQEMRETSGNTETANGVTSAGVTAASAIAILQEASGKGSRDSTRASYRSYVKIVEMCIELVRQFYTLPRYFRVLGQYGAEKFITYTNEGLAAQQVTAMNGMQYMRMPVFDIKVSAQRKTAYTKVTQNELALQFFNNGFFNPQLADQAMMCVDMMDFDGKDEVMQKIASNGLMQQKLMQYMELALTYAAMADPKRLPILEADIMQTMQKVAPGAVQQAGGVNTELPESDSIAEGADKPEPTRIRNAKARSQEASQPDSGQVIGELQ